MNRPLLFLLFVGVAAALPYKTSYGSNPHKYYQSKYDTPLSFGYMKNPLAMAYVQQPQVSAYAQSDYGKMAGEQFFKHDSGKKHYVPVNRDEEDSTRESLPYTVLTNYGPYEERAYPSAKFACVKADIDNSKDPFAGLEKMNPMQMMSSKRYKKRPSSYMFKELYKYISGVNKEYQEIEMTRPVSTHHSVKKVQFGGDVEVQEMCFYIPAAHQANPPQPLETSPVYIHQRPTMRVFVRRFGGWAMTAESWSREREVLETLLMGKPHHDREYYTNGYNSPWDQTNRRNEVWIQSLEAGAPVIAAVTAEEEDQDEGLQEEDVSVDAVPVDLSE